jgi:hypothetical protein
VEVETTAKTRIHVLLNLLNRWTTRRVVESYNEYGGGAPFCVWFSLFALTQHCRLHPHRRLSILITIKASSFTAAWYPHGFRNDTYSRRAWTCVRGKQIPGISRTSRLVAWTRSKHASSARKSSRRTAAICHIRKKPQAISRYVAYIALIALLPSPKYCTTYIH